MSDEEAARNLWTSTAVDHEKCGTNPMQAKWINSSNKCIYNSEKQACKALAIESKRCCNSESLPAMDSQRLQAKGWPPNGKKRIKVAESRHRHHGNRIHDTHGWWCISLYAWFNLYQASFNSKNVSQLGPLPACDPRRQGGLARRWRPLKPCPNG